MSDDLPVPAAPRLPAKGAAIPAKVMTDLIQGEDPSVLLVLDTDELTVTRLMSSVETFLAVLRDVDEHIAPEAKVQWVVEAISKASPMQLIVRPISKGETSASQLRRVTSAASDGFAALAQGERPDWFSERGIEKLRDLGRTSNTTVSVGRTDSPIELTADVLTKIDAVLGAPVSSYGTVEGRLEGLNVHGKRIFSVYDELTNQRIECRFRKNISAQQVGLAVERRVAVYGEIVRRENGSILHVKVDDFELFPDRSDLPTAADVLGIIANED